MDVVRGGGVVVLFVSGVWDIRSDSKEDPAMKIKVGPKYKMIEPQDWILDDKGEVVGFTDRKWMTREEFQKQYPDIKIKEEEE